MIRQWRKTQLQAFINKYGPVDGTRALQASEEERSEGPLEGSLWAGEGDRRLTQLRP
jgi:hypothetical protein